MKVGKIINVVVHYQTLRDKLHQDQMDYLTYKTLEPDEKQERLALRRIEHDREAIDKLLDMEV